MFHLLFMFLHNVKSCRTTITIYMKLWYLQTNWWQITDWCSKVQTTNKTFAITSYYSCLQRHCYQKHYWQRNASCISFLTVEERRNSEQWRICTKEIIGPVPSVLQWANKLENGTKSRHMLHAWDRQTGWIIWISTGILNRKKLLQKLMLVSLAHYT